MQLSRTALRLAPVALAASLLTASPAEAATLDVCASGCTYPTITAAVAAAAAGDIVDVAAGTYAENGIQVTKAITIRGAGPGQTIVDGGGLATSPTVGIFRIRPAASATSGAGTITVADMTVRNPSKQGSFYMNFSIGMKVASTGVTDITLDNLDVTGTNDSAKPNYGIYADGGAPISGVERAAPKLVIKNSSFSQTAFNNIGVDAWFGEVQIENNDLTEGVASGSSAIIALNEYTVAQITPPLVVTGNRSTGRLFYLQNITQVPNMPGWADVTVSDNTVTGLGTTDRGISVSTTTAMTDAKYHNGIVKITGNTLSSSGCVSPSAGIVVAGRNDDVTISGNTIDQLTTGVTSTVSFGGSAGELVIDDNDITGCGSATTASGIVVASSTPKVTVTGNGVASTTTGIVVGGPGLTPGTVEIRGNDLLGDDAAAGITGVSLIGGITGATVADNNVVGWGSGLAVAPDGATSPTAVSSSHNRYFADAKGLANTSTTSVASTDDWWGCHDPRDAANTYCSDIEGPITLSSWLALDARPTPAAQPDGKVHVATGSSTPIIFALVSTDGTTKTDATGLPPIFDGLAFAAGATGGTHTGPNTLNAAYQAATTYVAPNTAGTFDATGTADKVTLANNSSVSGEPATVRFEVANADSDGDGLTDAQEQAGPGRCGTTPSNPLSKDTDADGLGDLAEVRGFNIRQLVTYNAGRPYKPRYIGLVTTNACKRDSDSDGINDRLEVVGVNINRLVKRKDSDGGYYRLTVRKSHPLDRDTDNDYLTDLQEITGSANTRFQQHRTDPATADTDWGGGIDGREVFILRTDPAVAY